MGAFGRLGGSDSFCSSRSKSFQHLFWGMTSGGRDLSLGFLFCATRFESYKGAFGKIIGTARDKSTGLALSKGSASPLITCSKWREMNCWSKWSSQTAVFFPKACLLFVCYAATAETNGRLSGLQTMKPSAFTIYTHLSILAQNSGSDICSWYTLCKRHNANTRRLSDQQINAARKNSVNRQKKHVQPASCSVKGPLQHSSK